jgi:hypothetical protein
MTIDSRTMIRQLLTHIQAMAYQAKQPAMDGGNWRKLLDELAQAEKLIVPVNNAMRETETHVYLVSDEPLPDGLFAYNNEEGASQDAWDRGTSGADTTITPLPLRSAPTVRWTTGRD